MIVLRKATNLLSLRSFLSFLVIVIVFIRKWFVSTSFYKNSKYILLYIMYSVSVSIKLSEILNLFFLHFAYCILV